MKVHYCNILREYLEHFHFHSKKQYSSTKSHRLNRKGELNSDSKIRKCLYYLGRNIHSTFSEIGNKTKLLTIFISAINYNMTSNMSIIQLTGKLVGLFPILNNVSIFNLGIYEYFIP